MVTLLTARNQRVTTTHTQPALPDSWRATEGHQHAICATTRPDTQLAGYQHNLPDTQRRPHAAEATRERTYRHVYYLFIYPLIQ